MEEDSERLEDYAPSVMPSAFHFTAVADLFFPSCGREFSNFQGKQDFSHYCTSVKLLNT